MIKPVTLVASLVLAGVSIPCVAAVPLAQRRFIPLHNIPEPELAVQDGLNPQRVTSRDTLQHIVALPEVDLATVHVVSKDAHAAFSPATGSSISARGEGRIDHHDEKAQLPVDLSDHELETLRNADLSGVPLDFEALLNPSKPKISARDGVTSILGDKLRIPLVDLLVSLVTPRAGHGLLSRDRELSLPLLDLVDLDLAISNPTPETRVSLIARNEQLNLPLLNNIPLVDILLNLAKGRNGGLLAREPGLAVPLLDLANLDLSVSNPGSNTHVELVPHSDDAHGVDKRQIPLVNLLVGLVRDNGDRVGLSKATGLTNQLTSLPLLNRLGLLKGGNGNGGGLLLKRSEDEEVKRSLPVVDNLLDLTTGRDGHIGLDKVAGLTDRLSNLPLLTRLGLTKSVSSSILGGVLGRREQEHTLPLLGHPDPKHSNEDLATRGKILPRPLPVVSRHLDDEVPSLIKHAKNTRAFNDAITEKRSIGLSRQGPLKYHGNNVFDNQEHKRSTLHHYDRRQQGTSVWSAFYCEGPNYRGECITQEFSSGACTKVEPAYQSKVLSFLASSSNCVLYQGDTCSGSSVPIYSSVQDLRAFPRTGSYRCHSSGAAAITGISFPFKVSPSTLTLSPSVVAASALSVASPTTTVSPPSGK